MKFNKFFIVGIFLLAIFTFSAVSASDVLAADNNTDVLSVADDADLSVDKIAAIDDDVDDVVGVDESDKDNSLISDTENEGTPWQTGVIEYSNSTVYKEHSALVSLYLPMNATGDLVVLVDGESYAVENFEQHAGGIDPDAWAGVSIDSYKLPYGLHNVSAFYNGNDYKQIVEPVNFTVDVHGEIVAPENNTLYYYYSGSILHFALTLPENATGTLYVSGDIDKLNKSMVNGSGCDIFIDPSYLGVGIHQLNAYFISDDGKYDVPSVNLTVRVFPDISFGNVVKVFKEPKVTIETMNKSINGKCEIVLDNKNKFTQQLKNGKAVITLPSLVLGTHKFIAYYYDDNGNLVGSQEHFIYVEKASAPKLTSSDVTMFYQDGSAFKVRVLGVDGKPVNKGSVVIKINNKVVKTVKTNANGYATYKINNLPKKYTISATYEKTSISQKLTVKQPLALKKVKVKKSAKKLVLTATLKGKKAYSGKKVTFAFNGKKYAAKTNSKGVAKVTIKKAVLKKLKAGKKVKYQVTYLKDTVKRTAKVGK